MQNELPFLKGSATNLPRESVMLDDDVIEHRCPDLVVPQQRVGTVVASMAAKPRSRNGKMLRRHAMLARMLTYRNKTDDCRDLGRKWIEEHKTVKQH